MLDLHLYQFTYTTDSEQPYYLGITFNNSEVVVGFAPGEVGDTAAFEVTDKFNGAQLAHVNITHLDMVTAWHNIVTKAHHIVLKLHAEALEQAERDRKWAKLLSRATERFKNIERYFNGAVDLNELRSVTASDLGFMTSVVEALTIAGDKLDLIADPD